MPNIVVRYHPRTQTRLRHIACFRSQLDKRVTFALNEVSFGRHGPNVLIISVILGAMGVASVGYAWQRLHPRSYFSIENLIVGFDDAPGLFALFGRMLAPLIVAATVALLNPDARYSAGGSVAFLGAALVVWPSVVMPQIRPPGAWDRPNAFRIALILYVATYTFMGVLGAFIAEMVSTIGFGQAAQVTSVFPSSPFAMSVYGSLVAAAILGAALSLARLLQRWIKRTFRSRW